MIEPRTSTVGATTQLSAKIMEAQVYFQKVVKQELQVLVASGFEREVAVKVLLRRIVQSTHEPEESEVKRVMRQFQMIHDDAVRALIVKQEIGRLKRQGLDAFAAIELLTRKMQGISVPDDEAQGEKQEEETKDKSARDEMIEPSSTAVDENSENSSPVTKEEMHDSAHAEDLEEEKPAEELTPGSENALPSDTVVDDHENSDSPSPPSQDTTSVASLSLCERIDQVSISAASPDAHEGNRSVSPSASPALSTTHSTPRSAFTLFSSHSRKRRVSSGPSSPLHECEDAPLSPRVGISGSSAPSNQRPHFSMSRPMSPTFRFPKNKKQKLWADDTTEEPVIDTISLKETTIAEPPASPIRDTHETPSSSATATTTRAGKRRREMRGGASPELDEIDVEDPMVRVSKRHRIGADVNF